MEPLAQILRELGYTPQWLNAGVVDEEFLQQQYREYLISDDKAQEHYRSAAFWRYLKAKHWLTDPELDDLVALQDNGPDGCDLTDGRILTLLESPILSDIQYEKLSQRYLEREPGYFESHRRRCIGRRLHTIGISEETVEEIVESGDAILHRALLDHPDVERRHLVWLSLNGGNKAIRNRASQMLTSKPFRIAAGDDSRDVEEA